MPKPEITGSEHQVQEDKRVGGMADGWVHCKQGEGYSSGVHAKALGSSFKKMSLYDQEGSEKIKDVVAWESTGPEDANQLHNLLEVDARPVRMHRSRRTGE